jgi:hypothetical protein
MVIYTLRESNFLGATPLSAAPSDKKQGITYVQVEEANAFAKQCN